MSLPQFEKIYQTRHWGEHGNTLSGSGSSSWRTEFIVDKIAQIIRTQNIRKIADICGDFAWQDGFLKRSDVQVYKGYDVSPTAIQRAITRYETLNLTTTCEFKLANVCEEDIDGTELFICRDVLVHLNFELALKLLQRVIPKTKYILVTSFTNPKNVDIAIGKWRTLNLRASPFERFEPSVVDEFLEFPNGKGALGDKRLLLLDVTKLGV